jgi:hypothetical protein
MSCGDPQGLFFFLGRFRRMTTHNGDGEYACVLLSRFPTAPPPSSISRSQQELTDVPGTTQRDRFLTVRGNDTHLWCIPQGIVEGVGRKFCLASSRRDVRSAHMTKPISAIEHLAAGRGFLKESQLRGRFDVATALGAIIVAVCAAFVVAMTLRMVVVSWSPAPYWDQWDDLVSGRSLTWSWLVAQHSEHRPFTARLIFWLDRWLAAETNVVDLAANVLIQTGLSLLLAWLALRAPASDRVSRIWAYGLSFAFLFWAVQYENFAWGFQVQFFAVGLAAAATFAVVALGPPTGLGAGAAVSLAGAAVYSLASGIIVPALAVILGVWVGRPRWYLLVLLFGAIGWPASYLWGYTTPEIHSNPAALFSHLDAVILHFLTQIGGPFSRAFGGQQQLTVAVILGGVGPSLFVAALILVLHRPARPSQKAMAMFATYLLGAAFLTASGRVLYGTEQALSSRYATPVIAFWLSTILLWFSVSALGSRSRLVIVAASVALSILVVASEPRFARDGLVWALDRKLATPALLTGVPDPRLDDLDSRRDELLAKRSVLLWSRTSVFAEDWARLMGAAFSEHFTVDDHAHCSGVFLRARMIDQAGSGWNAIGTATLEGSPVGLRRIVLVNDDDRIVGYGLGGFDGPAVGEEPDLQTSSDWWIGSFAPADPSKVRAYALYNGNDACLVGSSPRIGASPAIVKASLPSPAPKREGHIDSISVEDQRITIVGWGYLSSSEGEVMIDTDLPTRSLAMHRRLRPDVVTAKQDPSLRDAGVEIRLALQSGSEKKERYRLCVWTDDPKYGRRVLNDAAGEEKSPSFTCNAAVQADGGQPAVREHN